jgi:hypothetical protein
MINEIETLIHEYEVSTYDNGKPASLGAYMSFLSFNKLKNCICDNKKNVPKQDWEEYADYCKDNGYLSPSFRLLHLWISRIVQEAYN